MTEGFTAMFWLVSLFVVSCTTTGGSGEGAGDVVGVVGIGVGCVGDELLELHATTTAQSSPARARTMAEHGRR
jgi:hypothetical protein